MERYLAGSLSEEGTRELFRFLEEEPGLFDSLTGDIPVISAQPEKKYPFKSRLLKSYSDLSEEQFEYLCIASAEGDLTAEQQEEFESFVLADEKRAVTYNLYKRLRLPAEDISYPLKNGLKRVTPFVRVTRVATLVMAAAASVAILVIALTNNSTDPAVIPASEVTASVSGTVQEQEQKQEEEIPADKTISPVEPQKSQVEIVRVAETLIEAAEVEKPEVIERKIIMPLAGEPAMVRIAGNFETPGLTDIYTTAPVEYQGPLTLRNYLAMAFRERILGEEIPDRSPIKAYEIASAGITGVNKLLGWDMNLEFVKEGRDDPEAVMFSSRLIKFQAPVKKITADQ